MKSRFTLIELLVACQPKPWRLPQAEPQRSKATPTRTGFTLIELLVVIAIIAILASLLLPALTKAKFRGKIALCISDHKQWGLAIADFASDFDGQVPTAIEDYRLGNRTPTRFGSSGSGDYDATTIQIRGKDALEAIGVLPALGYITTPEVLYCADWKLNSSVLNAFSVSYLNARDLRLESLWQELTDDDDVLPWPVSDGRWDTGKTHTMHYGTTHHQNGGDCNGHSSPGYWHASETGTKLEHVASNFRKPDWPPLMSVCNNSSNGKSIAHNLEGIVGDFYDGSAKWLPYSTLAPRVAQAGVPSLTPEDVLRNGRFNSYFHYAAQDHMNLTN